MATKLDALRGVQTFVAHLEMRKEQRGNSVVARRVESFDYLQWVVSGSASGFRREG